MQLTISLSDTMLQKIELYKKSTQKQSIEETVAELLQDALTLPPRQKFLETLRKVPDAKTEMTEEEQLVMIDKVRQEMYAKKCKEEQTTREQRLIGISEENIQYETEVPAKKAVRKLKQRLHTHLGKALERVIIFGSVARGTATNVSDIDVMIILNDTFIDVNSRTKSDIRSVIYPIELEDDVIFDLKVMGKSDLNSIHGHTPFVENVMREGITV